MGGGSGFAQSRTGSSGSAEPRAGLRRAALGYGPDARVTVTPAAPATEALAPTGRPRAVRCVPDCRGGAGISPAGLASCGFRGVEAPARLSRDRLCSRVGDQAPVVSGLSPPRDGFSAVALSSVPAGLSPAVAFLASQLPWSRRFLAIAVELSRCRSLAPLIPEYSVRAVLSSRESSPQRDLRHSQWVTVFARGRDFCHRSTVDAHHHGVRRSYWPSFRGPNPVAT